MSSPVTLAQEEMTSEQCPCTFDRALCSPRNPIRILIVHDYPLIRSGIRCLLEQCPEILVLGETTDGYNAVVKVGELMPDVVVTDNGMSRKNANEGTRLMKEDYSQTRIIGLSAAEAGEVRLLMQVAGRQTFITKENADIALPEAIKGFTALFLLKPLSPE